MSCPTSVSGTRARRKPPSCASACCARARLARPAVSKHSSGGTRALMAAAYPPQDVAAPVPYGHAPLVYRSTAAHLLAVKLLFGALIFMSLVAIVSDAFELNLLT